jgi:hypothetical protein
VGLELQITSKALKNNVPTTNQHQNTALHRLNWWYNKQERFSNSSSFKAQAVHQLLQRHNSNSLVTEAKDNSLAQYTLTTTTAKDSSAEISAGSHFDIDTYLH